MKNKPNELKLIYVLKIGKNTKGEGLYEFIFSRKPYEVDDYEEWGWASTPASSHAEPPTNDVIDEVYSLKTDVIDLVCLHEAEDCPYIHGYYTIRALAYEDYENADDDDYEKLYGDYNEDFDFLDKNDDDSVLVFHYGMTIKQVEDLLYQKDIILKNKEFIHSNNVQI